MACHPAPHLWGVERFARFNRPKQRNPLASVAHQNPQAIRRMVADFGDGTYGVKLGGIFYRVDADLPTWNGQSPFYAGLGQEGCLWGAIVEKAYAQYAGGLYYNLDGGFSHNAYLAMGMGSVGEAIWDTSGSNTALANQVFVHWAMNQNVSVCTDFVLAKSPLVVWAIAS